ncbi:MAG: alpha-2-macroglobulin family protein [Sphingobacteriales bacterium]|nr:MAG: alpha-2-macroglobulin family protein [Sphingobacteriales bacterium]
MKPRLWLLWAILCVAVGACKQKNGIDIKMKTGEEVEVQQNLLFGFDKDIFPDSLLNTWDTTAYIEFTPKVQGSFRWNSSNELMFSPGAGFAPGTEYTAVITKRVLNKSKKKYPMNDVKFSFHTAPLRVAGTHISWTRGQSMGNVMVQADVSFNYDVKVSDAAAKIKLSSKGQGIVANVINSGTGKMVSLQFMPVSQLDEETPLKIEVARDIPLAAGNKISQKDTVLTEAIPSRYNLSVTGVTAQHTGTEGIITVNTSQPVLEEQLKLSIALEPAVDFDVTASDAGFIITSAALKSTQTYQLTVNKLVEGAFGGKLKSDFEEQVSFGKLAPSVTFVNSKGMYLSSQGYKNLSLNIVNVPKLRVSVVKVYENNLEQLLRAGKENRYHYDDESDDYNDYEFYQTENLGDTIYQRTYETAKLPKLNAANVLHLDFSDKLRDYDGVYVITVASEDHQWIQQSKILSISDIGLIVKQDNNSTYVFANSIRNASALSKVKVSFISNTNQRMYSANTDAEGIAVFKHADKKVPGMKVAMVTAKMDDEFSFVWLDQSRVETSRFDVGGRMPNATNLNAMMYAERNLYRPGETINASVVIRNEEWGNPGEMPVKLKLNMPNGKEFATHRKILNAEGSCETSFRLPPSAMTGTYVLETYTGNDILLNSYDFSIEDFMPDRLKVQVKSDRTEYTPGDSVRVNIQADNLFGTPAAGRHYECMLNLHKVDFSHKAYEEYNFRLKGETNVEFDVKTGNTAANGSASEGFTIPADLKNTGMHRGNVMCAVSDETGRPVHRYQNITVYAQPVFVGVKQMDEYISTRRPVRIPLVALDKNGTPQNNVGVWMHVVRKEWHTVMQQSGSTYRYVSQMDEKVIKQQVARVSGTNSNYLFTPDESGEYELRIGLEGSNNYVVQQFYSYGGWDAQQSSFEVNNEGNVTIKPDKDKYNANDNMNILFTTPFEGRMLVTVERNSIMKHYYLSTMNRTATLSLTADDGFVPNVYLTATLFRPMDGSDMPLTVAHGFRSVEVENKANHLPVAVSISDKSRSKTKQTITVKTTPGAYVTIAAVDEGILQVRDYQTPDAYKYFYQRVALATNSYDIYPLLLPEVKLRRSSTGGDGFGESSMRVNPMFVNSVKNVSFWSGILQANSSGVVKYTVDIPQFSGDLRVMAIAYKGKAFGGGDQHMKVADPVIISTALPRFLSPKDEALMSVTMSNTTAKEATVSVQANVSGPLAVVGSPTQTVRLAANSEQRVVYKVAAASAIGAGKVTVTVKGMNEIFTNETDISIRPPASLQKLYSAGQAADGSLQSIDLNNDFIPSTRRGTLVVSTMPLVQFSKQLKDLVQYPYGCVEQTTSTAFPQLYYHDLVTSLMGKDQATGTPAYNVQQAISKLQSMQLSNGALSYWPGGDYESWWGSVYAAHFLLEAKKSGYEVNTHTLDRLYQYMKVQLNKGGMETLYYNTNMRREIVAKEIPYSLYVLALAGQPQQSSMNYYKARIAQLGIDSRYMLAAAYGLSGQPDKARQVLPPSFSGEKASQISGGSFYSYIRDQAMALYALQDIDANNPQIGTLAKQLSDQLLKARYLNTQENVFSVLAFGKLARKAAKANATADIISGGKVLATMKGQTTTLDLRSAPDSKVQIRVKGTGKYYYYSEQSGISATGKYVEEDSYLKIRRSFYTREGKQVSNNAFSQNDLIVVKLTIESQNSVSNIAITDMLPAGFEVENARLYELPDIKWIQNGETPDYIDMRDDRVNMFTNLEGKPKTFYYMVRAVSPGSFQLGPVQADAMYDGSIHSYHGAGVVKVSER